jgi:hypothetical protein
LRVPQFIAVAWLALICALTPAHAEKRVALVVGNAAYRHADKLANPVNDARGMRDALKSLGFDVTYGEDLDGQSLRRVIGQFADRVGDADVAMVYFAGHGATFADTPYVVPVDAECSSLGQVAYELVPVKTLIGDRLLSEAEFEYSARGRTQPGDYPRYWFGNDEREFCQYSNFEDQSTGTQTRHATTNTIALRRSGITSRTPSACTTWLAMHGSGRLIAITRATMVRPSMVRRGRPDV